MIDDAVTAIKDKLPAFSKGQKVISDYIINNYEKAAYLTAQKLGEAVGLSESTVVRFAIELGFEGYPEMQRSLQAYTKTRLTALQRLDITGGKLDKRNILQSILNHDAGQLRATAELCDPRAFEAAVDAVINTRKVYIFGAMSSNFLARFLCYYLQLIFDNVILVQASGASSIKQQLIRTGSEDALICISFPRYCKSAAETARFAKSRGAKIIAITDSSASPLAPLADFLLLAKSDMAGFADSLTAPLSLINALIAAVGMNKRAEIEKVFSDLEEIWDEENVYDKF